MFEPKGRPFAKFDVLYEKKMKARKFRLTQVDPFNRDEVEHVAVEVKHWGERSSMWHGVDIAWHLLIFYLA